MRAVAVVLAAGLMSVMAESVAEDEVPPPSDAVVIDDINGLATQFTASRGRFEDVELVPLPAELADRLLPHDLVADNGFFSFKVTGLTSGETVQISIILPPGFSAVSGYVKCGPSCIRYPFVMAADNVVTLTLTEGGSGDDDGAIDGVITSYTGAPVYPAPVRAYAGTSGGAFGLGPVVLLLLLWLRRALRTLPVLLMLPLAAAAAPEGPWYAGVRAGYGLYEVSERDLNQALAEAGLDNSHVTLGNPPAWNVYAGVPLGRGFSFEAGFVQFGEQRVRLYAVDTEAVEAAQIVMGRLQSVVAASTLGFSRRWLLDPDWSLTPRASAAYFETTHRLDTPNGQLGRKKSGFATQLGVTLSRRLQQGWFAGAGVDCVVYAGACTNTLLGVNLEYRYGGL